MRPGLSPRASILQRPGVPLPFGNALTETIPAILVGTPGAHAADVVQVVLRRGDAPPFVIRALRDAAMFDGTVQWFRAQLPALDPGRWTDYRVEWLRAGQRIATLPADGSWLRLVGVPQGASAAPAAPAATVATPSLLPETEPKARCDVWPSKPRFRYGLDFFAALTVDLRAEILGATPEGYRINFYVLRGRVLGPRIDAIVEPHGGDWMFIRPDGIGDVNIQITYRTRDGALILEQAEGVFDLGPDGYAKVAAGQFQGTPAFYATPTWSTAHPNWQWLNRCQGMGVGQVVMDKLQVQCDIYIPRIEGRIDGG